MRAGANFLWFILGGWLIGSIWCLAALVMAISIIGIPWARACIEIGRMSFAPFGREVVRHTELTGKSAGGFGFLRLLANLIWLPFGLVLAILHVIHGVIAFCTIIGIPFGIQDFKLAGIALFPVGKRVVSVELAKAVRSTNAMSNLQKYRA